MTNPAPTTQALHIVLAHNAEQLTAHIAAWDDLAAHTLEPNVFYESWHLLPALRVFGDKNFYFVFVYADRPHETPLLCGFFPLKLRHRYKGLPLRVLALWNHDYTPLCTPLIRAGYEKECLDTFYDWFTEKSGASLLELQELSADGPFQQQWNETLNRRHARAFVDEIYPRAFLRPFSESAEDYLRNVLSRKRRKELKRLENRLGELGCLSYEIIQEDVISQGIEEFLQLESAGWKGRAGTAFASEEKHRAFFVEVANEAAQRRRLMLLALRLNGRAIAMKFNLLAAEGAFAYKIAFDEEFSRFSPGVLLELDNIRCVHQNSALKWMDSCAIPDHFMINHLWAERRLIQNLLLSSGKMTGGLVVSLLPLLRLVKRRFKRKLRGDV